VRSPEGDASTVRLKIADITATMARPPWETVR
jgi:hypothetical protein